MVERIPLVLIDGKKALLPAGDSLPVGSVELGRQDIKSEVFFSTNSQTYQTALTLTTTHLDEGYYKVDATAIWGAESPNKSVGLRLLQDGAPIDSELLAEISSSEPEARESFNIFYVLYIMNGIHSFSIQGKTLQPTQTLEIYRREIALERWR